MTCCVDVCGGMQCAWSSWFGLRTRPQSVPGLFADMTILVEPSACLAGWCWVYSSYSYCVTTIYFMIYCWSTSILHLAIQAKGPLNKRKPGGVSGGQTFPIESLDGIGCWMCYLILRTPFVHSFADMTLMYLDTCARACRQKLLLKSLGAWFMTAVWRESSRDHRDFTRHSPLAIDYTPITFHSFWKNRMRVFQTHVAIKCQAHAQLFVAEKAARSAGGTVTGVHAFIIFFAERQPMPSICPFPPSPSLSLSITIWKNLVTFFSWLSAAFGFVWWSCLCRWQVGAMEAQLIRLSDVGVLV